MDALTRLTEIFRDFPGIGGRQAKRFVYFLLSKDQSYTNEIVQLIGKIKENVRTCQSCFRFFNGGQNHNSLSSLTECEICRDPKRDRSLLAVVSHDADLESLEKSRSFNGFYFVLGGVIPILEKSPEKRVRVKELGKVINGRVKNGTLKEVILAMNCNTEGEHTGEFIKSILSPLANKNGLKISFLGRGLSTGTELEYSDADTLKSAVENRQ